MCLPLIAPHLIATPLSPIGPHSSRTTSLTPDPAKRHVSLLLIQSRRCAVHRLVSHVAKFLHTCRRNSFFSLYTNQHASSSPTNQNMNFRGGCCIARYGGGGGGYDMSKVDRIMLRYRPIAPRPDSGGSSSSPTEKNGSALTNVSSKSSRRGKRKYSKENNSSSSGSVNSNGNSKRRRNEESKNGSGVGGEMMTLPLLPETPEKKDSPLKAKAVPELGAASSLWLSFNDGANSNRRYQTDLTLTETVVASLLTLECVTERWVEAGEYELGCRDEEIKMNLERDTCPGFISDGLGRVVWTNGSYRELVVGKDQEQKMSVWLVMKERPLVTYRTFTCRMRLQYTCRDKEVSSITSFCDVWRMNDGGFAWRLDVDAALCLGR